MTRQDDKLNDRHPERVGPLVSIKTFQRHCYSLLERLFEQATRPLRQKAPTRRRVGAFLLKSRRDTAVHCRLHHCGCAEVRVGHKVPVGFGGGDDGLMSKPVGELEEIHVGGDHH